MEEQKVFATAWRGFEKKAVLEYIYEQDVLFKRREAELNEKLAEYERKLEELERGGEEEEPSQLYQERIEALEQSCNEQRRTAALLQEQCEKLRREADQLVQMSRSKEGELQLQTELNRQLQQKCDTLEEKLKTLAEYLLAERGTPGSTKPKPTALEAPAPEEEATEETAQLAFDELPEQETVVETDEMARELPEDAPDNKTEFTDLRGELSDFRQSVSQTLLNFEAALARLEADPSFFR